MATNGFSFEELTGPTAERKPAFVPADRTSKPAPTGLSLDDVGGRSDKVGTLPKDKLIFDAIRTTAKKYDVPEEYIFALANQESNYNPQAKNSEFGATGIMQYIPSSASARGLDPTDPIASIDAAGKDFADAMKQGGVDWAIKHHFAGPDVKGHGPKTRQYLADVSKRAQDIRTLLGSGEELFPEARTPPVQNAPEQSGGFSFEDLQGAPAQKAQPASAESGILENIIPVARRGLEMIDENAAAIADAGKRSWEFIKQRISDKPGEYLGRPVKRLQLTAPQIAETVKGMSAKDAEYVSDILSSVRTADIRLPSPQEESARITARNTQAKSVRGFLDNLEAPAKLMLKDSLPANLWETVVNAPDIAYEKVQDATKIIQQYDIVRNPGKYPPQAVQAARRAIAQREVQQETGGIKETWRSLVQAAKEDPGGIAAQFVNTIVADPELLALPEGVGIKVAAGVKKVATGAEVANKVVKVADKVLDAASTNAALNLGIESAAAASEGRTLTAEEAKTSAVMGGAFGGTLAGLSGVLSRGASAVDNIRAGKVGEADLQKALQEAAAAEAIVSDVVETPNRFDPELRAKIEEGLGIQNLSDAEKKAWHTKRQRELTKTFREQSLDADYLNYVAEERINRRTQLAEDGEAREAAKAAEAAKQQEVERAYQESQLARTERFADEYEQALAAREDAKAGDEESAALAENQLRDVTRKLDEQDIMEAALEGDVPAIRNAMLRATQRDAKLARPKWQRGEASPEMLARIGVGGLFAGTAYALAPEEQKARAAFASGLAGLILPKGGSVLNRMRQAGAVSADGDMLALARLVKEGKLKPTREIEEVKAREAELLNLAKRGDQRAMQELFEEHYGNIERFSRKLVRGTDIDAADVAQETFLKAFQNLDKLTYGEMAPWLYSIAKNTANNMRRDASTLKGGGEYDIISSELPDVVTAHGEKYARDAFDEGAGAEINDTPENHAIRQDAERITINALARMNDRQRRAFILSKVEGYSAQEIAQMTGQPLSTVLEQMQSSQDMVLNAIERGFGAKKRQPLPEAPKRGRGRPRKQTGEIDPTWMKTAAILGVGGTLGAAYVNRLNVDEYGDPIEKGDEGWRDPKVGAVGGVGLGLLLFGRGKILGKTALRHADDLLGTSSTRILNKSKSIYKAIQSTERRILTNTHEHIKQVDPFLVRLNKMPKAGADILARALMTGKGAVIDKILNALGDQELITNYKAVRKTLDSLGDQLVNLKRFSRGNIEYFPRIVKDKEGLFKAIGKAEANNIQAALEKANVESLRKNGRPLGELEESAIINQMLFVDKRAVQPGFAKHRGIEEITPELQQFYASPAESLHSYIRAAVQDIEGAKFFGGAARNMKRGQHEFLDVDRSVKNLIADEVKSGKLSNEDAQEIADILRTRFKEGLRAENDLIRNIKNMGNIGLLGNFWSAATQLGDVAIQTYTQGLRSTIESIVRQATGKKLVDMRDFGLADHVSEEFAGQLRTTRWVNNVFKATLFSGVDRFGKNTALNAAVINAKRLAQTDSGVQRLANKYQEVFGEDFPRLVSELKSGKIGELTRDFAFMELSKTQPISRIEMPLAYMKHPNARSYLWLKSFTVKQLDLVRREAYNEIKNGNVAKGVKNLTQISILLGLAGATTEQVKTWLHNAVAGATGGQKKETDMKMGNIAMNAFKTYGFSEYMLDQLTGVNKQEAAQRRESGEGMARTVKPQPVQALASYFVPPFRVFDSVLSGDPKAYRYLVPGLGPYLTEQVKRVDEIERGDAQ